MENITVSFEDFEYLYNLARISEVEELRFELVMSALFPNVYDNIKEEMARQHTLGYIEGYNEGSIDTEKEK